MKYSESSIDPKILRSLEEMGFVDMTPIQDLAMDMGTVVDGETAVKEGLIDSLGGLSDAIEALYELIETGEKRYPDDEVNE